MYAFTAKRCGASFVVALAAIVCTSGRSSGSEPFNPDAIRLLHAPLGLERLANSTLNPSTKLMRKESFEVFDVRQVPATDKVKLKFQGDNGYLQVDPFAQWSQKLRAQHSGANYVTFTINGSVGTAINVCGAAFAISQSSRDAGYASIRVNDSVPVDGGGKVREHELPLMLYGGARMAALDIVTVKIDRRNSTWTMWIRDSLFLEDVPLAARAAAKSELTVTAGQVGAWVCGLVCADENPIFEDANDNAVPDDFEIQLFGKAFGRDARPEVVSTLKAAWKEERRTRNPITFVVTTPLPDSFPEWCEPNGKPVHDMTNGLKFGPAKK